MRRNNNNTAPRAAASAAIAAGLLTTLLPGAVWAQQAGTGSAVSGQDTSATTGGTASIPLGAASASSDFDLDRTIREALASSAQIQIQQKQVQIDDQRVDQAEAANRPTLSGNGRATRYDAPTSIAFGGQSVTFQKVHEEALSLSLSERLDLLGQVRAARSQARLQQAADHATRDSTVQGRTLQAKTIYFDLLRAQHQVQVAESALQDAQTQEAIARRLYDNQVGQKIDLLRAQTNTAQAQQNLTAAQNDLDVSRATFNDLVGRPLAAPVTAHDVPGASVGVEVQPSTAPIGSAPQQTLPSFTPFPVPTAEVAGIDLDRSIAEAQTRRPEVVQGAAQARAAEVGVRIAREGLEPSFALSAEGDYYPTTDFAFPRQKKAAFTISASIPLYDGGLTRDQVREARLRTDQAQTSLASTKEDVALQVRQAYLNLLTAARQIDSTNTALQQAIAARQLAQVRYEGQVGLFLEVTDAQAALVRSESDQVNAVYNYLTARARFENALGIPALQQSNTLQVGAAGAAGNTNTSDTTTTNPAAGTTTTTAPAAPPDSTGPTTKNAAPR